MGEHYFIDEEFGMTNDIYIPPESPWRKKIKYKVLKDFLCDKNKRYKAGDTFSKLPKYSECYTDFLLSNGFIEEVKDINSNGWEAYGIKSELANIIITPEDYTEGGKKHYTWHEAMKIEKHLDNGWRLPTLKEWVFIAWEFGENKGVLDSDKLQRNLSLGLNGFIATDGQLYYTGSFGFYWSSSVHTESSTDARAYALDFSTSSANPSNHFNRYFGFSVRLVKDIKK